MYFLLQATTGPYSGRKIPVPVGGKVSIGREEASTFAFFSDTFMSRVHAEVMQAGFDCVLHDLDSSNGTFLNGRRVEKETLVRPGDRVQIGETQFDVSQETLPVEKLLPEMELDDSQSAAYSIFKAQGLHLYALVDSTANPQIAVMLRNGRANYMALGDDSLRASGFDPYLVSLPQKNPLLRSLVSEGWNNHWGLYLTTEEGFRKLAKHLTETLLADMRPDGRLRTRFSDTSALTGYFRRLEGTDRDQVFGPVYAFFTEDPAGTPFRSFTRDGSEPMLGSMLFSDPKSGGDFGSTSLLKKSR